MKKKIYKITALFLAVMLIVVLIPFNKVKASGDGLTMDNGDLTIQELYNMPNPWAGFNENADPKFQYFYNYSLTVDNFKKDNNSWSYYYNKWWSGTGWPDGFLGENYNNYKILSSYNNYIFDPKFYMICLSVDHYNASTLQIYNPDNANWYIVNWAGGLFLITKNSNLKIWRRYHDKLQSYYNTFAEISNAFTSVNATYFYYRLDSNGDQPVWTPCEVYSCLTSDYNDLQDFVIKALDDPSKLGRNLNNYGFEYVPGYRKTSPYYNTGLQNFDVNYYPSVPNFQFNDFASIDDYLLYTTDNLNAVYTPSSNQLKSIDNYWLNQEYSFDMELLLPVFDYAAKQAGLDIFSSDQKNTIITYNNDVSRLINFCQDIGGKVTTRNSTNTYDYISLFFPFTMHDTSKISNNGNSISINTLYDKLSNREKYKNNFGYDTDRSKPLMSYINDYITRLYNAYDTMINQWWLEKTVFELVFGVDPDKLTGIPDSIHNLFGYETLELVANFFLNTDKIKTFKEVYNFLTGSENELKNTLQNIDQTNPPVINDVNKIINTRDTDATINNLRNGQPIGGGSSSATGGSSSSSATGGSGGSGGNASATLIYKGGIDWETRPINGSNLNVAQGIGTGINVLKEYASGDIITLIKAEMDFIPQPVWNILIAVLAATAAICIFKFFIWIL